MKVKSHFIVIWIVFFGMVRMASAATAPPTPATVNTQATNAPGHDAEKATDDSQKDVSFEIKIDTSRPQPYVGSGLGITAELKNKSKKSVLYLLDKTTTLTLPPEMDGPFSRIYSRNAFFPSENKQWEENQNRPESEKKDVIIAIQPGYSYRAAWVQRINDNDIKKDTEVSEKNMLLSDAWRQIKSEIRYLFFLPGEYKIFVQAKVGVNKSPLEDGYYTFSEVANVKVAAPQFVIILGAIVGGLISWLLFPQGQEKTVALSSGPGAVTMKIFWIFYSILGACLLSAIVTILVARLSDSQFLVKISITDFWSAAVVGFIAQYAGKSVLDKLIPGRPGAPPRSP